MGTLENRLAVLNISSTREGSASNPVTTVRIGASRRMERPLLRRGDSWEEEIDAPFDYQKVVTALESLMSTIELIDQEAHGYGAYWGLSTNKASASKPKEAFSTSSPHQRFRMRIG